MTKDNEGMTWFYVAYKPLFLISLIYYYLLQIVWWMLSEVNITKTEFDKLFSPYCEPS